VFLLPRESPGSKWFAADRNSGEFWSKSLRFLAEASSAATLTYSVSFRSISRQSLSSTDSRNNRVASGMKQT
jgi:hypothetical protein